MTRPAAAPTAGPWTVEVEADRPHEPAIKAGEWYVATAHDSAGGGDTEANARLIAAAPDLLAAAKIALRSLEAEKAAKLPTSNAAVRDAAIHDLRAALAKAGEQ